MRETLKSLARGTAFVFVLPALISFFIRTSIIGRDRALEGSSQMLALIPGIVGQYLRQAFLAQTIAGCAPTATISFGTILSKTGARIDDNAYIGPGCSLGLVHIGKDVLIGSGVHITSGRDTHGTEDPNVPIREQEGKLELVRIGAGSWIGSGAIVMADVGERAIVGAGAVVAKPIPDAVVAVGVPATVVRTRS